MGLPPKFPLLKLDSIKPMPFCAKRWVGEGQLAPVTGGPTANLHREPTARREIGPVI